MLRNADGVGGVIFSGKNRYEGVRFNVISVTRGWVGVQFPGKKRYVTLEWPLTSLYLQFDFTVLLAVDPSVHYDTKHLSTKALFLIDH